MKLPSGIDIEPNLGLISIDEGGDIYEGYDGNMSFHYEFSIDDRIFIAESMVLIWATWLGKWKAQQENETL